MLFDTVLEHLNYRYAVKNKQRILHMVLCLQLFSVGYCGFAKAKAMLTDGGTVAFHSHYCSIFPWIHASVYMNFNVF